MSSWAVRPAVAAALLALLTTAVYAPVRTFPFVVYDDKDLVTENPPVRAGLTREGTVWAFTHAHMGNYVPLAWHSHMADVELFGLDPGAHHAVNALLHAAAVLLLFASLRALTGALGRSAFVAALFAVHPTHVESVAWVSERRDTLSAVFFMLVLLAWERQVRRPARGRYALAMAALALGILAKPMLVTLPLLLLALDHWPLGRREPWAALVREKLPLFGVAAAGAAAAFAAQAAGGAVASLAQVPLAARASNALVAAVRYVGMTLWPADLAVFYPFDFALPAWQVAGAALLLAAATAGALATARTRPYLAVGWAWYLATLLPVLGLVQVGSQALADRYTYLPSIGLGIAAAWGAVDLAGRTPRARAALGVAALALVGVWAVLARAQLATWRSSVALFENALAISGEHPVPLLNLAEAYEDAGRDELARSHYERALALAPAAPMLHVRLGDLLARTGDGDAAAARYAQALRLDAASPGAQLGLGRLALRAGRLEDAQRALEAARTLPRDRARALLHLGEVAALEGQRSDAAALLAEALHADPALVSALAHPDDPAVAAALAEAHGTTPR
jgi:tetratricopeptide (TPR) repeat protein